jgi:geranylgeranyl diphosphate synthase type I
MRRGQPCIHKLYGIPITINSGDGLLLYTLRALETTDSKIRAVLHNSFIQVLNGQGEELNWNMKKKQIVREQDYLKMVSMKTGALISAACETGGMLGRGTKKQTEALRAYGMAVGVAFQIQDDILNLTGEEKLYKKEIGGDITEGKRTLMTIHTLNNAPKAEAKELLAILNSNTQDKGEISKVVGILSDNGSIDYAKEKARSMVKSSEKNLNVLPDNKSTRKLIKLADFLIEREF